MFKRDAAPEGYSIIHEHRRQMPGAGTPRGGGIAIIHRDSIDMKVQKVDPTRHKSFELLLVKLPRSKNGLKVAVIYRPPRTNVSDFITEVSDLIDSGDLGDQYII